MNSVDNPPPLALVTGTSSGIGAALAAALLGRGWTVIGLARRAADFDHPDYRHIALDLADLDALEEAARRDLGPVLAESRWSRAALVNNAALSGQSRGLETTAPGPLRELLAVNTVAPMFLMGFVTRVTPPAVPLRIVNVSSGAAVRAFPGLADYCASKAALRMAGMALADRRPCECRQPYRRQGGCRRIRSPLRCRSKGRLHGLWRGCSLHFFPWNGVAGRPGVASLCRRKRHCRYSDPPNRFGSLPWDLPQKLGVLRIKGHDAGGEIGGAG